MICRFLWLINAYIILKFDFNSMQIYRIQKDIALFIISVQKFNINFFVQFNLFFIIKWRKQIYLKNAKNF